MHAVSFDGAGVDRSGSALRGPDFVDVAIDPSWLDFGPHDPLDAENWINPCAACGAAPTLQFNGKSHVVLCCCGAEGHPGTFPSIAAVNWNKSPRSAHPRFQDLPFFHLQDLSVDEARAKLLAIRAYLEEQRRRCEWRIKERIGTGHRYHQRVRAYLLWAVYAQSLLKEQAAAPAPSLTPVDESCVSAFMRRLRGFW